MPAPSPSFANQLLIALPTLADPNFARTVGVICQHDDDGAMGVVVNRASDYTLGEVLRQMGIESDDPALLEQRVLAGGPVHPERGFVLHDGERVWDSSLAIADGLQVTTDPAASGLPATLGLRTYLGRAYQYQTTAGGLALVANGPLSQPLDSGARVTLTPNPEQCAILLPE